MPDCAETIFTLIEYELWCNNRALDFLSSLREDECRRDFGFGLRTPHRTIFHIADVMRGWSRSVGPVVAPPSWSAYRDDIPLSGIREMMMSAGSYWLAAARFANSFPRSQL